jgi:hypothetical protein
MVKLVHALNRADNVEFSIDRERMFVTHGKRRVEFVVSDWEILAVENVEQKDEKLIEA